MFKLVVTLRNIALAFSLITAFVSFADLYELTTTSAVQSGIVVLFLQFIANKVGTDMANNAKNANASPVKKALIASGFGVTAKLDDKEFAKKYAGKEANILQYLPLLLIAMSASNYVLRDEASSLLFLFIASAIFVSMTPIYTALKSTQEQEAPVEQKAAAE